MVFSFLVIMSKFYLKILNFNNKYFIIFSILLCNLILWSKAEGIVYAIIILIYTRFLKKKKMSLNIVNTINTKNCKKYYKT